MSKANKRYTPPGKPLKEALAERAANQQPNQTTQTLVGGEQYSSVTQTIIQKKAWYE